MCLNKPFKKVCRNLFADFCQSQLATAENPNNRLKTASKLEVLRWVVAAQSYLSSKTEMIAKSFRVTGILPNIESNGTPDVPNSSSSESEEDPFCDLVQLEEASED